MTELSSPPSLTLLYPKALAGVALPLVRKLPLLGGGDGELPSEELVLRDAGIDEEHLAEYRELCGFPESGEVPLTYPQLLAFPLSMQLMTACSFPLPVIGMVHIENRIEQRRPIAVSERFDLSVRTDGLRSHERGRQFDVIVEARVGGEAVWRGSSTYLRREGGGGSKKKGGERERPPEPDTHLDLPGDAGRRYGAVSGDRNPIHLHPLSARLFGMSKPIAHGMWLAARSLVLIGDELPGACEVDVRFKLPVPIPGRVSFASWPEAGGHGFAIHDEQNEKPHLSGVAKPLAG